MGIKVEALCCWSVVGADPLADLEVATLSRIWGRQSSAKSIDELWLLARLHLLERLLYQAGGDIEFPTSCHGIANIKPLPNNPASEQLLLNLIHALIILVVF